MTGRDGEISQTLDRGLATLSFIAESDDGLTVAEVAERLATARAVVYRLLRTLEGRGLVTRVGGRYLLGFGVSRLASRLRPSLQAAVLPLLRELADRTRSTALLTVADGDQALVLATVEPTTSTFHLALREGSRHPLDRGADGIAILAGRPAAPGEPTVVADARAAGHAVSISALQPGAVGVAAPITLSDRATASIGVVRLADHADRGLVDAVREAAAEAARRLGGADVAASAPS